MKTEAFIYVVIIIATVILSLISSAAYQFSKSKRHKVYMWQKNIDLMIRFMLMVGILGISVGSNDTNGMVLLFICIAMASPFALWLLGRFIFKQVWKCDKDQAIDVVHTPVSFRLADDIIIILVYTWLIVYFFLNAEKNLWSYVLLVIFTIGLIMRFTTMVKRIKRLRKIRNK